MRLINFICNKTNRLLVKLDNTFQNKRFINYSQLNNIDDSYCLKFSKIGEPEDVLKYESTNFNEYKHMFDTNGELLNNHIVLKNLAAPINPSDINYVQGIYGVKTVPPAVGGFEGVARVAHVSTECSLSVGDMILYNVNAPNGDHSKNGTWRTHCVTNVNKCWKIPATFGESSESILMAATMTVNLCSAYRMLMDFCQLEAGDCIIQNGSTSAVGQAVIQIAKTMGVSTINVIRASKDDDTHEQRVEQLKSLGATHVITEDFVQSREMQTFLRSLEYKPSLFLNCVGGRLVNDMSRSLKIGSTIVTYGGMSMKPITLGAGSLIFKDLRYCGYWMNEWNNKCNQSDELNEKRKSMVKDLSSMYCNGLLKPFRMQTVKLADYRTALEAIRLPGAKKQVLVMDDDLLTPTL